MLESLEIYPKGLQDTQMDGLIVVYHKSKQGSQAWMRGMNILKVNYDSKFRKVIKIINLASGYAGDH